jgi:hypothetical protein
MGTLLSRRVARRRADDDQSVSVEEAAGLLALSRSAIRLRGALRTPSDEGTLRHCVTAYVLAAAARDISLRRTRDALELLVNECASRRQPTCDLLDLVLRLASEVRRAPAPQLREAV